MAFSIGKKIAAAAVVGFVGLGAGAAAWATEGSSAAPAAATAPAGSTAAAGAKAGGKKGGVALRILKRADHGTIEIKVKGATSATPTWQTFTFDKGSVTTISATSITVARPDGQSTTLTIGATTKFRGVTTWQAVLTGKPVLVISENGTATQVIQAKAKTSVPPTSAPPAAG
jgi:hypothetical protein